MQPKPSFRRTAWFVLVFAGNLKGGLSGGSKSKRDHWYGLSQQSDFDDFKRWWHRVGKDVCGGGDIATRTEAETIYADWIKQGRPKVK